jgi:signal transduction histidine kinase/CheY-like chemotaxis protein
LNLYDRDRGTFRRFGVKDGLPNATIYGLLAAPDGDLWISTNLGLSRFDPDRLTFDNYDVSDGLQSNEFNSQSCRLGASGEMYFGGINGLTVFKPGEIRNSALQPRLVITDFQVLNRPVGVGVVDNGHVLLTKPIHRTAAITLHPTDRVVTLEFAAFDYAATKGVTYAYMLEGFDAEWHYVTNHRYATYTNLPRGNFTFRVRGTNHDGVWSPHEARLAVTMQPPFWGTTWFMVLASLSGLGLLRGYYTYRTRMMRRRNHELEDKVALRTADLELEIEERVRTEDRLREATGHALAATRAKTEFLANMSHEIRTPLNGVIGLTGALLDTRLDEEQAEYCQIVQSSANALLNVINDVLDFSKMEVGKLELEAIDLRPREVVDEIADMLGWQAYEKGLTYAGVVAADVPSVLCGDPARIRQVLLNLVGNAIKFTTTGRVEVRVTVAGQPGLQQQTVRWAVVDTGVGIPAGKQNLLFLSFSQVDASTTRRYGGTGLGLAISKQLVELMGGRIGCESAEGEGATFWFEIPMAVITQAAVPCLLRAKRPGTILLVSCEDLEHETMAAHLAHCGEDLIAARNSEEGLAMVRERRDVRPPFSAVIIGRLPGMEDPGELARRFGGGGSPVAPLVLLSDLGDRMDRRQLCDNGFISVLTLPLRYTRLVKVLDELAGGTAVAGEVSGEIVTVTAGDGQSHLLLAEDNPVNQRVAGLILTKLGFTYDVVGTGLAAVEALRLRHYDAVLMDVQMPEMDGLEATRVIRDPSAGALNPLVPILAMTAHAMASDRIRCLEAGMNDHLTKPIQSASIAEALGKYVGVPLAG